MSRRGIVVAVEGLDGVGKTTLCQNLPGFVPMATPGAELADARRAMHAFAGDDPVALQVFYASSVCAVGRKARALAAAGQNLVIDRYWLSTVAYGLVRGGAELADVGALVPPVDFTVVLVLDEEERQRRLIARGGMTAADQETFAPAFRERVLSNMRARFGLRAVGAVVELETTGRSPAEVARAFPTRLGVENRIG